MEEMSRETLWHLMGILQGRNPISSGVEIIAQDVVSHMDGYTFRGINTWANWIRYIRARSRVEELDLEVHRFETHEDGTITARGRWKAQQNGRPIHSKPVWARYRVVDGKIVEIWTTRYNYAFMLGPMIHNRVGHLGFMIHVFFWGKSAEPLDLRLASPTPPPAAQALNG